MKTRILNQKAPHWLSLCILLFCSINGGAQTDSSTVLQQVRIALDSVRNEVARFGESSSLLSTARTYEFEAARHESNDEPYEALLDYYQSLRFSLGARAQYAQTPSLRAHAATSLYFTFLKKIRKDLRANTEEALLSAYKDIRFILRVLDFERQIYTNPEDKIFLLRALHQTHEYAIEVALALHHKTGDRAYKEAVFEFSERDKSSLLRDFIRKHNAALKTHIPDSLTKVEQHLTHDLARIQHMRTRIKNKQDSSRYQKLNNEEAEVLKQLQALNLHMESVFPDYYTKKYNSEVASVGEIQLLIPQVDAAILEYFIGERAMYVMRIRKRSYEVTRLPLPAGMNVHLRNFRQALTDMEWIKANPNLAYTQYTEEAQWFYNHFIRGVIDEDLDYLIVIPDGLLHHIPFDALLFDKPDPIWRGYGFLPYLLRRHTISYSYSATLLIDNFNQEFKGEYNKMLGFAAQYDQTDYEIYKPRTRSDRLRRLLVDLPGARKEVQQLQALYLGDFFIGKEASEKNFKANADKYSVIHLALHGLLDTRNALSSSLAFSDTPDPNEDNFLYAYEMMTQDIKAQLVVLSACETGYGKYIGGEGVASIARGFMLAGTPSLVVTLWQVSDNSTARIMRYFYERLASNAYKVDALRDAKLKYFSEEKGLNQHPFFWAAYSTLGDPGTVDIKKRTTQRVLGALALVLMLLLVGSGIWLHEHMRTPLPPEHEKNNETQSP